MSYNTAQANEFVDNVERTVLEQIKDAKPDMVRSLFTSVPWMPGDGEKVTFNSIALSGYAQRVDENEDYPEINPMKGNELSKTQIQYGDKLNISRRMMKFNNRYSQAQFDAQDLVGRLMRVLDNEMTQQIFAEADQTTFTPRGKSAVNIATSDGVALAASNHSYGGVSFSNLLSGGGALSKGNLTAAIDQGIQNTPDDFGTYITPNYDTIVIANNQKMIVKCHELFGSSLTPESANNAANFYGGTGSFKVVALREGDRNANGVPSTDNIYRWAIMDSNMVRRSFQLMMAEDPTTEQRFVDSDNLIAKILVTQFAAFAAVQPQGTVYSLSTTAPTLA